MTSSDTELYHQLNSICGINFINTLMYFISHILTVGPLCSFGIRTNLFDSLILVCDNQAITPSGIYLLGKSIIAQVSHLRKITIYLTGKLILPGIKTFLDISKNY